MNDCSVRLKAFLLSSWAAFSFFLEGYQTLLLHRSLAPSSSFIQVLLFNAFMSTVPLQILLRLRNFPNYFCIFREDTYLGRVSQQVWVKISKKIFWKFCQKKSSNWRDICTALVECKQTFANFLTFRDIFFYNNLMSKTCWDIWYLPILITSGRDFVVWKIQINAKKGRSNRSGAAILNDRTSIYSEGVIEMRNRATPCSCWCSSSIVNIRPVILSFTFWKNEKDEFETQEVLKLGSLLSGSADNPHIVSEGESANTAQGL